MSNNDPEERKSVTKLWLVSSAIAALIIWFIFPIFITLVKIAVYGVLFIVLLICLCIAIITGLYLLLSKG